MITSQNKVTTKNNKRQKSLLLFLESKFPRSSRGLLPIYESTREFYQLARLRGTSQLIDGNVKYTVLGKKISGLP